MPKKNRTVPVPMHAPDPPAAPAPAPRRPRSEGPSAPAIAPPPLNLAALRDFAVRCGIQGVSRKRRADLVLEIGRTMQREYRAMQRAEKDAAAAESGGGSGGADAA